MDEKEIYKNCTRYLNYHPKKTIKEELNELVEYVDEKIHPDNYGDGELVNNFEKQMAELLGKEAAVFMPSGTMAQQIALRIWCEKANNLTVAMHSDSHLNFAEHYSYLYLHNIKPVLMSMPDYTSKRMLTPKDFENLKVKPGAILLELPQRTLGGQLPSWEDLEKISKWAKENQVPLHLDGARLWESKPFYQKEYADICSLFDTVYISFYKGLGGITGSILAGQKDIIDESRVWQRRLGGNLKSIYPYVLSAKFSVEQRLDKFQQYHDKAVEIASRISKIEGITVTPNPPHSNMFLIHFKSDIEGIKKQNLEIAKEHKFLLVNGFNKALLQGFTWSEVNIGDNALDLDIEEIEKHFKFLMSNN